MKKCFKNSTIQVYSSYNQINKNNKDVVEISQEEYDALSPSEKKKYKYLMTKDKSKVKPPKGPTDHELLLLILSKVDGLEHKVDGLEHKVDGLEHKADNLQKDYQEFKSYVQHQFDKHGW